MDHRVSKKKYLLTISYSHTCYVLRQMGYVRLKPRSWPLEQDEARRGAFQQRLAEVAADPAVELWFQDESGFAADPKPRRVMALKGSRPRHGYTGTHLRENVVGAVRPRDGKLACLMMPEVNTETFQIFLDHLQTQALDRRIVLVLDNASWHKAKRLRWGRIEPFYLPPYSPDFNCIERLWLDIKNQYFTYFVTKLHEELSRHLEVALKFYIDHPEVCYQICGAKK